MSFLAAYYFHSHPGFDQIISNYHLHKQCLALLSDGPPTPTPYALHSQSHTQIERELLLRLTNQMLANRYRRYIEEVTGRTTRSELGLDCCEDFQTETWKRTRGSRFSKLEKRMRLRSDSATKEKVAVSIVTLVNVMKPAPSDSTILTSDAKRTGDLHDYQLLAKGAGKLPDDFEGLRKLPIIRGLDDRYARSKKSHDSDQKIVKQSLWDFWPLFAISKPEINVRIAAQTWFINGIEDFYPKYEWVKPAEYLACWCAEAGFTTKEVLQLQIAMAKHREDFITEAEAEMARWRAKVEKLSEEDKRVVVQSAVARKKAHEGKWRDESWRIARMRLQKFEHSKYKREWEWSAWATSDSRQVRQLHRELGVLERGLKEQMRQRQREMRPWNRVGRELSGGCRQIVARTEVPDEWLVLAALVWWK